MLNIEQLLYFDKLRSNINEQIEKHEKKIAEARKLITDEEENIRHLGYDLLTMKTILDQTDPKWAEKINNYYKSDI